MLPESFFSTVLGCFIHLCLVTECGRIERESLHASLCQWVCACSCVCDVFAKKGGSCLTLENEQCVCVCLQVSLHAL